MKTSLQELIERLEEKKNYHEKGSNFFVALGLAKQIATELLEKEKAEILNAYFEGKMDTFRENRGHMIAELYFKERYNQNK